MVQLAWTWDTGIQHFLNFSTLAREKHGIKIENGILAWSEEGILGQRWGVISAWGLPPLTRWFGTVQVLVTGTHPKHIPFLLKNPGIAGCEKPRPPMILECGNMRQDLFDRIVHLPNRKSIIWGIYREYVYNMCTQYLTSGNSTIAIQRFHW